MFLPNETITNTTIVDTEPDDHGCRFSGGALAVYFGLYCVSLAIFGLIAVGCACNGYNGLKSICVCLVRIRDPTHEFTFALTGVPKSLICYLYFNISIIVCGVILVGTYINLCHKLDKESKRTFLTFTLVTLGLFNFLFVFIKYLEYYYQITACLASINCCCSVGFDDVDTEQLVEFGLDQDNSALAVTDEDSESLELVQISARPQPNGVMYTHKIRYSLEAMRNREILKMDDSESVSLGEDADLL